MISHDSGAVSTKVGGGGAQRRLESTLRCCKHRRSPNMVVVHHSVSTCAVVRIGASMRAAFLPPP